MPHLLDLFCGAGGAAIGYFKAGWTVVGVDHLPQPYYPFKFVQAKWDKIDPRGFDAIHASPPCQAYSKLNNFKNFVPKETQRLIGPVRDFLISTGLPYVVENVPGAPLLTRVELCGDYFGLGVRRHRWFETNWGLRSPVVDCRPYHKPFPLAIYGEHWQTHDNYLGDIIGGGGCSYRAPSLKAAIKAMGYTEYPVDWHGLTQAIPPAYTEYIGKQLLAQLENYFQCSDAG